MLTDKNLIDTRSHLGGTQRIYRNGRYGLSLINAPMLHSYPFAWEAGVFDYGSADGKNGRLTYDTPLTNDVEVFDSEAETQDFIDKAFVWFESQSEAAK